MLEYALRSARRRRLQAARLYMAPKSRVAHASCSPASPCLPTTPVYLVIPEQSLRLTLVRNLWRLRVDARAFDDTCSFADALPQLEPGCLVIDIAAVTTPRIRVLDEAGWRKPGWPIILMFGSLDVDDAVRAVRLGASDLLRKPVAENELLDALRRAVPKLREQRLYNASLRAREAIDRLSTREREIVQGLKEGLSSKEIGRQLGLSHRTVETYRNNLYRKLGVLSLPQLLKIAWLAHGTGERNATPPAAP